MNCYINCIKTCNEVSRDIKELIPDMNIRRRMSGIIKNAVSTGLDSLTDFGERCPIEAVITASRLGCIADSEKFLSGIIGNNEQMLNPTPFIQSTFNTVGAQIALLKGLHCYNMTYSHCDTGFESALLDAVIQIESGAAGVLAGIFDELTPTVKNILEKCGIKEWETGALFFILSAKRYDTSVAEIHGIEFEGQDTGADAVYCTDPAKAITEAVRLGEKREYIIINGSGKQIKSVIKLKCI